MHLKCCRSSPCFCISGLLSHLSVCNGNWDFQRAGPPAVKYLFSPDWSEAAKTRISGFLGNQVFCEKAAHFSLQLFYHPLSHSLSSSSVSHLLSCRHALHAAYLTVCFCVMHTNVWHYDMITQCKPKKPPRKQTIRNKNKKSRCQNRTTCEQLSIVKGEKASSSLSRPFSQSSLLLNINKA